VLAVIWLGSYFRDVGCSFPVLHLLTHKSANPSCRLCGAHKQKMKLCGMDASATWLFSFGGGDEFSE
jgi:hypothetical protein